MPGPGFGNQPQSNALRVTVVGHASRRWRGAANATQATRLNEALSRQRADNIRALVEQLLRQEIPGVDIAPGTSSTDDLEGVRLGAYGVGSREPVQNPVRDPNDTLENDPLNRSVRITIELLTSEYRETGVSLAPHRVSAKTKFWYATVDLTGMSVGAGGFILNLTLRNSLSGKTALYKGKLFSGGISTPSRTKPKPGTEESSFYTDREMGFDDFDDEVVRIEKAGATLGIKASVGYLTFPFLGPGARLIPFERKIGIGIKPSLQGIVAGGWVHLWGPNPGDWYEVDGGTGSVPYTAGHQSGDSLLLTFPTGKASAGDLTASDRSSLTTFVKRWASRV